MSNSSHRGRLAVRLTLSFLTPALLGLLAVGLLADHAAQQAVEEQLSQRLVAIANAEQAMLAGYFTELAGRVDAEDSRSLNNLRNRISAIADVTEVRRVFVFRPDLTSVVDTESDVEYGQRYYELEADARELEAVLGGESRASALYYAEDGTPYKYAYAPLHHPDTNEVVAIVGVEGSSNQAEALASLRRNSLFLGFAAIVLLLTISIIVSRRLTSSVDGLVAAATQIGRGELEKKVPQTRTDELGALEDAIERMRISLRGREEEMQMMLSGIAHEVRNPLGGIELFLGLLREDLELADIPDEQLDHVRKIDRELDYLSRVVQEFLDFARRSQIDISRLAARELVDEVHELMMGDMMAAEVALQCEVDEGLELTVDRDRMKRVLVNLLRNAIQASAPGDTVVLQVEEAAANRRHITVRDEGGGIAPAKLKDVFRPFYTSREKGTGLGLPMTKKIAEAHGGTIDIDSSEGVGTTVALDLPFDDTIEATRTQMAIPEGWLG